MHCRLLARASLLAAVVAAAAHAQSGLRVPERSAPGLDPGYASGWFTPQFDRFGFARREWREPLHLDASRRSVWGEGIAGSRLSLTFRSGRETEYDEQRRLSLFGRYFFANDWALSAETMSHDASGLLRLQDFRIGVQRQF